ncbi:hypothetical protein M2244_001944 [Rhodoferax antarcticus]|nr:hypothetical protein [Rhodoferax antarcticus]
MWIWRSSGKLSRTTCPHSRLKSFYWASLP